MTSEPESFLDGSARLIADLPVAVALFDRDFRYVAASEAWAAAFGLAQADVAGHRHDGICAAAHVALDHVQRRALAGESLDGCPAIGIERALNAGRATLSGRPHRGPDGAIAGIVVALREGETSGRAGERAHDRLGLPDRPEFARRLQQALVAPEAERGNLLVLAVSLDNLRGISNLHGYGVGDQILRTTGERLLAANPYRLEPDPAAPARRGDIVAWLGGGEFGLICTAPASPEEADALAARLLRTVQDPMVIGDRTFRLAASVGLLMTTPLHRSPDEVLRDLDVAAQKARSHGPGKVVVWEPALTRAATRTYSLGEELRHAFENGEFVLHYQPVLRLSDQRLIGAEALLRWNHPREGLAPSASFIPVLEEIGLIGEVGCWVVREAVRQVESWRTLYGRNIVEWVGVNLSGRQLGDPAELMALLRSIHAGDFSVHRLKLEMAEPVLTRNPEIAGAMIDELRELGVGFAIDDFGTGASSLEGLRRYRADTIKIDGEFVAQIGTPDGDKLLRALLDVAQMSGAAVIAEGIETEAQRDFLRQVGCSFGQGYLLAGPMGGAALGAFALTHAVAPESGAASWQSPRADIPVSRTAFSPTSEGRLLEA